jgi:hypothetical protein
MMASAFVADVPDYQCYGQTPEPQTLLLNMSCFYDGQLCGSDNKSRLVFDKDFGETIVSEVEKNAGKN